MQLSIIVTTYGRFDLIKRLVISCENYLNTIKYEIVVVASDEPASEKIEWLSSRPTVKLICVGDRQPGKPRQRSLYFYENLGITEAIGDWIFIINDDSEISESLGSAFLRAQNQADILVVPAHIDNPKLGHRVPEIGSIAFASGTAPLYLLDFAIFSRSALEKIGPADEGFDWYGRGADMSIRAALKGLRTIPLQGAYLNHFVDAEQRNPPHFAFDFYYLAQKWKHLSKKHATPRLVIDSRWVTWIDVFYARALWPVVSKLRVYLRKWLRTTKP